MPDATDDIAKVKKRRPKQTGVLIATRAQPDMLKLIDEWRQKQPDQPSRPEALRRLAMRALGKW
jgi:hypothetical protein